MDYAWINSTEYLYTIEGKILFFRAEAIRNLPIQQELFFFQISIFKPLAIIYTNDIAGSSIILLIHFLHRQIRDCATESRFELTGFDFLCRFFFPAEAGASEAVLDLPNVCANTSTLVTEISNVNGKVMTEYLRQYNDSIIVRIDLGGSRKAGVSGLCVCLSLMCSVLILLCCLFRSKYLAGTSPRWVHHWMAGNFWSHFVRWLITGAGEANWILPSDRPSIEHCAVLPRVIIYW
jgi:hypothetical protein